MRTRPNAISSKGIVASSSIQASIIGSRILERGGNVVDAAIATSAALAVTQNNLCGLGGDMFALVRMEGRGVTSVNGSGRSGSRATIDMYEGMGMSEMPQRGEYSAITVPGLVRGWETIHSKFGSMEFRELISPAMELAANGFPVTHNYSASISVSSRHLAKYNWKDLFIPGGKAPEPGELFRQKDLASTLGEIASDGPSGFYDGHLQERIISGLEKHDTLIDTEDFIRHRTTIENPLFTEFAGTRIYETSPNSQGATVLLWLNILKEMREDPDRINMEDIVRSGLLAYEERAKWITDPAVRALPSNFLSPSFARELLEHGTERPSGSAVSDRGDTTYFTVSDAEGNAVSMIQSNYMGFGSGIVPDGTGFVMQNRGAYFTLNREHHNALAPGKRTFHTLCASMGERDGVLAFSLGTMGGDIQPQIHVQIMKSILLDHMDMQLALDAPRWAVPYTIYENPSSIIYEHSMDEEKVNALKRIMNTFPVNGLSSQFGHAQGIMSVGHGVIMGGADPRGDGVAIPIL
jgi:gamma-glutamyltranspeptidase/glutathione hydrolase